MLQNQLFAAVAALLVGFICASDPELTRDFFVPVGVNASTLTSDYFTFNGFRNGSGPANPSGFAIKKLGSEAFPSLTGLGVSLALLEYKPGSLNPPHTHPRATELIVVLAGSLHVGFVDSTNKLFEKDLEKGDVFVFPRGLVHFQINRSNHTTANVLASFSSSNPGLVSLPSSLFASGIPVDVLTKGFHTSGEVVGNLEKALKT